MNRNEASSFVDFMHAKGFLAKAGVVINAILNLVLGKPDTTNYAGDRKLITLSQPEGVPRPPRQVIVNKRN